MDEAQTIVSGNKVHRPLMDKTVTAEDWEKARVELRETPETREAALQRFKQLVVGEVSCKTGESNLHVRTDDLYLLRFLRARKFDVEAALKLIKLHHEFRTQKPDVFPAASAIEHVLRANIFNYLPHRDHMGRAIFLVNMRNWNPDVVAYHEFVAAGNILSEYVLENPVTQINGFIGIWDFQDFDYKRFKHFVFPTNTKLLLELMQARFPGRFKVAYCINCYYFFHVAWEVIRLLPIMIQKFRNRVNILGSRMAELHEFVDPCILPIEYGGNRPTWPVDEMVQRVLANQQLQQEP